MTIDLYNVAPDPEHLQQTLPERLAQYTGAARDPVSVDRPEITIQAKIIQGNYVYIQEFGRYYWILEKNVIRDDLTIISLESDPLMSFAAGILQLPVYVYRSSAEYNSDMIDRKTPTVVYDRVAVIGEDSTGDVITFNSDDTSIYLQCIGGEGW